MRKFILLLSLVISQVSLEAEFPKEEEGGGAAENSSDYSQSSSTTHISEEENCGICHEGKTDELILSCSHASANYPSSSSTVNIVEKGSEQSEKISKNSNESFFIASDPLWLISKVPNIEFGTFIQDKFEIALSYGANSEVTVTEIHSKYYFISGITWDGIFAEISFSNRDFKDKLTGDYLTKYHAFNAQHTSVLVGYKQKLLDSGFYCSAAYGLEYVQVNKKYNERSLTGYGKYLNEGNGSFKGALADFSIGYSF